MAGPRLTGFALDLVPEETHHLIASRTPAEFHFVRVKILIGLPLVSMRSCGVCLSLVAETGSSRIETIDQSFRMLFILRFIRSLAALHLHHGLMG